MDLLSFPCSVRTLRSELEFRELGLDRASTTAIPISNTGIIPAGGITTSNPTMGTTEDRHMIRITGVECIPITTVIICIKPRWAQSTETRGQLALIFGFDVRYSPYPGRVLVYSDAGLLKDEQLAY